MFRSGVYDRKESKINTTQNSLSTVSPKEF